MNRRKIDDHYVKIIDSLIRDHIVKNDAEFAVKLGVQANVISNIRNKNKHVSISQIYKTCILFNISADDILFVDGELDHYKESGKKPYKIKYEDDISLENDESEYITKSKERLLELEPLIRSGAGLIPVYQLSSSDSFNHFLKDPYLYLPEDYIFIPNSPSSDGILRVFDDRMSPVISKGDLVSFKRISKIENHSFLGDIYLILQGDDAEELLTISNIQATEDPSLIKLVCLNKHYPDQIIPITKIKALAKVKLWISINAMS